MWWGGLANVIGGIGVVYLVGIPVQAAVTGTSVGVATVTSLVFLPGDALKVAIATAVASAVHRGYPGITPRKGETKASGSARGDLHGRLGAGAVTVV
jgi:biotin transport system substrate-specific component